MGDVVIKLCAFAEALDVDLETAITMRWAVIQQRNFTTDPQGHGIEKA